MGSAGSSFHSILSQQYWRAVPQARCQHLTPNTHVPWQTFNSESQSSWPAHTHTHTPFNGPFSGTTRVSRYQKGKPNWILLKQETVSGSGISWAICKSAPSSRQTTTTAPHHSVFTGRMPFLPPSQQHTHRKWPKYRGEMAAKPIHFYRRRKTP